jgi:hypothetical protein
MERYEHDDFVDEEYFEDTVLLNRVFTYRPSQHGGTVPEIELWNTCYHRLEGERRNLAISRARRIAGFPVADR